LRSDLKITEGPMQMEPATFAAYANPVPAGGSDPPSIYIAPGGVSHSASVPEMRSVGSSRGPVSELVRYRTATGRVVRNSDGTLTVQESTVPNYPTKAGWVPIDNTLRPVGGGWVGTTANSWTVALRRASDPVLLDTSAGVLSATPVGASGAKPVIARMGRRPTGAAALSSTAAVPPSAVVTYRSVWRAVDVRDTVASASVSEDLVLRDSSAPSSFLFELGGASLSTARGGGVRLGGALGKLFEVSAHSSDDPGRQRCH
jgi:hypothetical protein